MKTKTYKEPTMKVVKLQHIGMLMTSDESQAHVQNYTVEDSQDW